MASTVGMENIDMPNLHRGYWKKTFLAAALWSGVYSWPRGGRPAEVRRAGHGAAPDGSGGMLEYRGTGLNGGTGAATRGMGLVGWSAGRGPGAPARAGPLAAPTVPGSCGGAVRMAGPGVATGSTADHGEEGEWVGTKYSMPVGNSGQLRVCKAKTTRLRCGAATCCGFGPVRGCGQ